MANEAEEFEPYKKLKRGAEKVANFVRGSSTDRPAVPRKPTPSSPAPDIGPRDVADAVRGNEAAIRSRAERAQLKSDQEFTRRHGPMAPIEPERGAKKQFRKARPITRKLGR